ncbi:MAG TPA: HAD family phosphatase [Patescibacteria group bacterium]
MEKETKEIKAIIFDYGGVFTRETRLLPMYEHCAKKYGKEISERLMEKANEAWNHEQVVKSPVGSYWNILSDHFGVSAEEVLEESGNFYGFEKDVLELAKSLKKKYKVGMITNNIMHWFDDNIKNRGLDEVFDDIVTSYDVGIAKPDRRIYELALENLGVLADECVFIDDSERNIIGAQNVGMRTVLFKNLGQLEDELKELGI